MRHSDTLNEQLQTALNSRVIIEQAKGKLAERLGLDMAKAFSLLRDYARDRNRRLVDVAQAFVTGPNPSPARPGTSHGKGPGSLIGHPAATASAPAENPRPHPPRMPRPFA